MIVFALLLEVGFFFYNFVYMVIAAIRRIDFYVVFKSSYLSPDDVNCNLIE